MKFPPAILEEIRARLPVSAVVGKRVRLIKAGKEWKGLSPFNAEKTPSFYVNDQKGFYHCFSSGKHGDIFSFLMEVDGLPFPEAVERLAAEAGVTLPRIAHEAHAQEEKRKSLVDVVELACRHFEAELAGRNGAKARAYLEGRGLGPELQRRFRIGYAPADRFGLRDHLAGKGVTGEAMVEAGLLVTGDEIAVPYDRFRDRVMFPIADARGRIIAFGGRAMQADVPAKYLNSPETALFHKGSLLYNHHNARKAAHDAGTVIAVEGYVDVIAMAAAGFAHTVAPLGTALTEDQLGLMWRMAPEPILCFDGDKAGRRAAYRAIDVALPLLKPGRSLRFAMLPEGQDPDDLARSGGAAAIERVIGAARPLVDMLWAREVEAGPLDTPERRAALERRMAELLSTIREEDLRRHYRAEMDQRLSVLLPRPAGFGRDRRRPADRPGGGAPRRFDMGRPGARMPLQASEALQRSPLFAGAASGGPREAMILSAFVCHPELIGAHAEDLVALEFMGRESERLRGLLIDVASEGAPVAPEVVASRAARAGLAPAIARLKAQVRPGDAWLLAPDVPPERVEDALRQAIILHRKSLTLHSELKAAETALAESGEEADLAWLRDVQTRIASIEGAEADRDRLERGEHSGFGG